MVTSKKSIKASFKHISIQPESPKNDPMKMPYPYMIDPQGLVGRQDFWKGAPHNLIGFSEKGGTVIDLELDGFFSDPEKAVGLYPIFEHRDRSPEQRDWFTYKTKIASVRVNA